MDEDECVHGLGPVSACVLCNGRARREAKQEAAEREANRDLAGRIAWVMARKREADRARSAWHHRVRDGAWESPTGLSDDLLLPGGAIDERGPIERSTDRPYSGLGPTAKRRIEGLIR